MPSRKEKEQLNTEIGWHDPPPPSIAHIILVPSWAFIVSCLIQPVQVQPLLLPLFPFYLSFTRTFFSNGSPSDVFCMYILFLLFLFFLFFLITKIAMQRFTSHVPTLDNQPCNKGKEAEKKRMKIMYNGGHWKPKRSDHFFLEKNEGQTTTDGRRRGKRGRRNDKEKKRQSVSETIVLNDRKS